MNEQKYKGVDIRTNKTVQGKLMSKVSKHFTDIIDERGELHIVFSGTLEAIDGNSVCNHAKNSVEL